MKKKKYRENYAKKARKTEPRTKKKIDIKWITIVTISAFIISFVFSIIGENVVPNAPLFLSFILVFFFVFLGILFDIIGISVTVADVKTFNSMATKRVRGAKLAVKLIKNAEKMSSFCNDVIGDICGILSGSTGAAIAIALSSKLNINAILISLIITAIIASLTIGGKAIGKSIAMNKSNFILYHFAQFLSFFYHKV